MAKVRLVKGPFAGKVVESNSPAGSTYVRLVMPKPMSRKQKYQWQRDYLMNNLSMSPRSLLSKEMDMHPYFPRVSAEYKIVMRPLFMAGSTTANYVPCMHPDGSFFYEYVPDSKKEY
jgi:hypothetical protein